MTERDSNAAAVEHVARAIWEARQNRAWNRVFAACNADQLTRARMNRLNMDHGWQGHLSGGAKERPQDFDDLMDDARAAIAACQEHGV